MAEARADILAAVRAGLGRGPVAAAERDRLAEGLAAPRANLVPARARREGDELVALFIAMAERAGATLARVETAAMVAAAVADFMAAESLGAEVRMAPDPALDVIAWAQQSGLVIGRGRARDGDRVSVTHAFAGIAETGTCMLLSGPESPTTLNLLVDAHIVVLPVGRILGSYEDAWARLRRHLAGAPAGGDGRATLPRTVNLITGPSRSADIEQKLQMGAHGPRRQHIVLVEKGDRGAPDRGRDWQPGPGGPGSGEAGTGQGEDRPEGDRPEGNKPEGDQKEGGG